MNSKIATPHPLPEVHPRAVPDALLEALKSRFGE